MLIFKLVSRWNHPSVTRVLADWTLQLAVLCSFFVALAIGVWNKTIQVNLKVRSTLAMENDRSKNKALQLKSKWACYFEFHNVWAVSFLFSFGFLIFWSRLISSGFDLGLSQGGQALSSRDEKLLANQCPLLRGESPPFSEQEKQKRKGEDKRSLFKTQSSFSHAPKTCIRIKCHNDK